MPEKREESNGSDLVASAEFLGLRFTKRIGSKRFYTCVECGARGRLHWDLARNTGHCKECDTAFGPMQLLKPLVDKTGQALTADRLKALADHIGVLPEVFEGRGLGFQRGGYVVPILDQEGELGSLRWCKPGCLIEYFPGCPRMMWGLEGLRDKDRPDAPILLCDSEFNAMAVDFSRTKNGVHAVVLGMPGPSLGDLVIASGYDPTSLPAVVTAVDRNAKWLSQLIDSYQSHRRN